MVWAIAVVASLSWCVSAVAGSRREPPTIYAFDANVGSDLTPDASPDRPARTMTRVLEIANSRGGFQPGDQVWRAGTTTESVNSGAPNGVWHRPWPGRETGVWRGATPVSGAQWSVAGGTTYRANIGADRSVFICVDRWLSRVDQHGRHYGYLRLDPTLPGESGLPSPGTWHYDASSGLLYVRLVDGADPRTLTGDDAVMWINATFWSGLYAQDGLGNAVTGAGPVEVDGGSFRQFLSFGSVPCYGLTVCGLGASVRDLRLDDCSIHHLSIVSSSTRGVVVENVACWGGGLYSAASQFVVYSGNADVERIVFRKCDAHPYTLLDSTGQPLLYNSNWSPLYAPHTIDGFYAHTFRLNGTRVTDLLWDRCSVTFYGDTFFNTNRGTAFNAGDTSPAPEDPWDWAGYGARGDRCRIFHGNADDLFGNIAFRNRFADFTNARVMPFPFCGSINFGTTVLFESCVFVVNSDSDLRRSLYHLYQGARILMVNCTIIDLGGSRSAHEVFSAASSQGYNAEAMQGFSVSAIGCLFYFHQVPGTSGVSNVLLTGDTGAPDSNMHFDGCAYFNLSRYGEDASRDAESDWRRIDPRGIFGVDPGLVDPMSVDPGVAGQLREDSPLRRAKHRRLNTIRPDRGYNEAPYDGTVGAWQVQDPPRELP